MFPKAGLTSKKRRVSDEGFIRFVKSLPCLCTGKIGAVEFHHLLDTGLTGGALKSPDRCSIPLDAHIHRKLHDCGDETLFLFNYGITDAVTTATHLYEFHLNNDYDGAYDMIMRRFL